jgi:hypothetical protein
MKSNILVISDGNGVDTDFKKWPFYLKLLTTKTSNIINRSVIGASNEMMFLLLSEAVSKTKIDFCVMQWSIPNRVDVVLDEFWLEQAQKDLIYHFNIIENNEQQWWITSASSNQYIREYHDRYINYYQSQLRSQIFIMAAAELLRFNNIEFVFSLCYNLPFIEPNKKILQSYPWAWHKNNDGLSEFRIVSKFAQYDTGLPQPHSLIHLDWINTVLKPNCNFIKYEDNVYNYIESSLLKTCSK